MIRTTSVFLCIVIFFFCSLSGLSQTTTKESIPLITFLKQIEVKHNISFSYADANIKDKLISLPPNDLNLEELLAYLEANTTLSFRKLNNGTVLIIKVPGKESKKTSSFNTQYLDEVIVTNYLTKGLSLNNDGTTNIKSSSLEILPGLIEPDVLQAIQAIPGIQSVDERVSNVNIRGGTHDQNLILWDGIKMYQSGHFFGLISAFNPYLTEEVLISKNGSSAIYGDGVSGVVDMRSSNTISDETSGGGGFNLINADAYAKIPFNNKIELQVSARRSLTDLITTPTYDQYSKRIFQDTDLNNQNQTSFSSDERFYFYDATAKFIYDISQKDKLKANFLNVVNSLTYEEASRVNDIDEELNSKLTQQTFATSIEYIRNWNKRFSTSIQGYFSRYNLDATNFDVTNGQRLIQENEVNDNGLKLHFDYALNDNFNLKGGYQFAEVGVSNLEDVNSPVFRSYIKEVVRTHALFNELEFVSNSGSTITKLGVRGNHFEKFSKSLIEPRLSFSQRFLNFFKLELLGELKSQSTSQIIDLQNDFLGIEKRRWVLANDSSIPIIKSKQLSTSIRYNRNGLIVGAEAYIKKVDGITTRSQGFQNQYQFVPITSGAYEIKGVDLLINKQFENASAWLSYTYSKNDYTFKELNLGQPFPNNADIRHTLTFAGTYTMKRFKLALGFNWRTGKPFTQPLENIPVTGQFINYETPNSSNLNDYLRTDLSAIYTFKAGNKTDAIAGFSLWNVFDRKNIINTYYVLDQDSMISKVENVSLGITPNFSFRIKF